MKNGKKSYKLYANWYLDRDPENCGIKKGWDQKISATAICTTVPSIIQETLPGYHGVAFYWCSFVPVLDKEDTDRIQLYFGAVDYKADVYLNGSYVGTHEGGETPFRFDVTEAVVLGKENLLSVRVINPVMEDIDGLNIVNVPNRNKVPHAMAGSCLNHGGIWGEVELICLPAIYLDDVFLTGDIHTGKLTARIAVESMLAEKNTVSLALDVYNRYGADEQAAGTEAEYMAAEGCSQAVMELTVPDVKWWDVDDPHLYRVEVCIHSAYGCHKKIITFGFREFLVKDGYFYLNGRRIFLKSAHTGNAFPVGQGYPSIREQVRKDLVLAKSYGFNMVRAISGMLRTEQLEVADEIGLMIYEETYAGWNLGNGFFLPGNGLDRVGDEEAMLARFDQCTIEMIRRDRNHSSITIWGLLNEMMPQFPVTKRARDFLPRLREEDPTRLVLFDSGRWDQYTDIASGSNPYSDSWDAAMGSELMELKADAGKAQRQYDGAGLPEGGDLHMYPNYPLSDSFIQAVRTYAKDYRPAFFSETGMSSVFNVAEEAKHYEQYGYRTDLEDYVWIKSQADKLNKDWARLGLQHIYPYAEMMLKESQRCSAEDRRRIFDAIRSNPKLNGYSITGLLDHGWCGEGLWSLWRRFKPEIHDVVCDGWAPLRFCLFAKGHVYSGETFEIEAVLANEGVLKEGDYVAEFAITGKEGTVEWWSENFSITDDSFAVPVMKKQICLKQKSGKYSLIAYMKGASPLGNKLDFFVTDPKERSLSGSVSVCGIKETTADLLRLRGLQVKAFAGECDGVILAGEVKAEEITALQQAALHGARVLFLDSSVFFGENSENTRLLHLNEEICFRKNWEWLYHKESVMANKKVFKDLGHGLMDPKRFGQVITSQCIETALTPDDVICPAFYTGYYGYEGSYACVHNAFGVNCGSGKIYLTTFDMEGTLGTEPAAEVLLLNFTEYLLEDCTAG